MSKTRDPKTPERSFNLSGSFSPSGKNTPSRDLTGPGSTAERHGNVFESHVQQWDVLHKKSFLLCRTIQALKLHEIMNGEYPAQLLPLTSSLLEATEAMGHVVEGMMTVSKQLNALAKLCPSSEPLINTWSATQMANEVVKCVQMYSNELKLKKTICENIAHCRDEHLTEVYVSSWEYPMYINELQIKSYLAELKFS